MSAEKAGFKHFMLKEIHEQPRAVTDTLRGRLSVEHNDAFLDGIELDVANLKKVTIIACGTSWHAALVGKFMIERWRASRSRSTWRRSFAIAIRSSARATSSLAIRSRARRPTRWRR